ncbi:MAG: ParB/RepB/Spo0J family partition protein, partial [Firmicutes bacterium]|nr:ParB/RepB/Spo0J family partition protein [Bacillota bacterium]
VLVPTIVRKKEDGRYEMISGHRRKKASELLGIETVPCIVRDLTDEEATIIMVDSNLQREKILPSEKAFAYKLKLNALNHKGKRTDLTSSQVATRLDTATIIGKEHGDSRDNVYRYIRLTYLIPKLLEYVDNTIIKDKDKPSIAFNPAIELSYLKEEEQQQLLDYIDFNMVTPSLAQAIRLRDMSEKGTFNVDSMELLLEQEKPNQTPKLKVSMNRLSNVLPSNLKNDREREEYVIKAVEWYDKYLKHKKKERSQER